MKSKVLALILPVLLLVPCAVVTGEEGSYSSAISVMIGQGHRENGKDDLQTVLSLGWEQWTGRTRIFGFYLDGSLILEEENGIAFLSYGISLRPLGRRTLDPFLQIGFAYGKTSQETEYFAMPVTLGVGYWLSEGFGLKAQFRYQAFCKETIYDCGLGFFLKL